MIGPSKVAAGAMDVYGEAKFNQLYVDIELVLVLRESVSEAAVVSVPHDTRGRVLMLMFP